MVGLVNDLGIRFPHNSQGFGSQGFAGSDEGEAVIVTPCRPSSDHGPAVIRDRVFAAHCDFSWRSETVSTPTGDGRRKLVFKRVKQTGSFERAAMHDQIPQRGDRITRAWDGATFEIAAVYSQPGRILCDLIEINLHLQ